MGAVRPFHVGLAITALIGLAGMTGCGLLAPGFAVPAAMAANEDFVARGQVIDPMGKPLSDVTVTKSWMRVWWDAVWYTKPEYKTQTLAVSPDGTFEFKERGSSLVFTFKKDGYESQDIRFDKEGCITSTSNILYGDHWPKGTELCVILEPKDFSKKRPVLPVTWGVIDKPVHTIDLPGQKAALKVEYGSNVTKVESESDPRLNIDDYSLSSVRMMQVPRQFVIRGAEFVRFDPKGGSNPMSQMAEAPTDGYSHAFVISWQKLQAMFKRGKKDVIKGHEFFYFKIDGKYGKGELHWAEGEGKDARFGYTLIFNPDGTRNLVSQEPPR